MVFWQVQCLIFKKISKWEFQDIKETTNANVDKAVLEWSIVKEAEFTYILRVNVIKSVRI